MFKVTVLCAAMLGSIWASAGVVAGNSRLHFVCDGDKGHVTFSLLQHRVPGQLALATLVENGAATSVQVKGRDGFPLNAALGESLYFARPLNGARIQLARPLDAEGRFAVTYLEYKERAHLECRLF